MIVAAARLDWYVHFIPCLQPHRDSSALGRGDLEPIRAAALPVDFLRHRSTARQLDMDAIGAEERVVESRSNCAKSAGSHFGELAGWSQASGWPLQVMPCARHHSNTWSV